MLIAYKEFDHAFLVTFSDDDLERGRQCLIGGNAASGRVQEYTAAKSTFFRIPSVSTQRFVSNNTGKNQLFLLIF